MISNTRRLSTILNRLRIYTPTPPPHHIPNLAAAAFAPPKLAPEPTHSASAHPSLWLRRVHNHFVNVFGEGDVAVGLNLNIVASTPKSILKKTTEFSIF
jgi:hypothetical protein